MEDQEGEGKPYEFPFFIAIVVVFCIWMVGGVFPIIILYFIKISKALPDDPDDWQALGQIGDNFGAANALFSSGAFIIAMFALVAQIRELRDARIEGERQTREFREQSRLQAASLAGQVLIPIFSETRDSREALEIVSRNWRSIASNYVESGSNYLVEMYKRGDPGAERAMDQVSNLMTQEFIRLRNLYKNGTLASEDADWDYYQKLHEARRKISVIAQKVYQIGSAGLANEKKVLAIAAFPDFVSTYKYYVYPLDLCIERERNPGARAYEPGAYFIEIYTEGDLKKALY